MAPLNIGKWLLMVALTFIDMSHSSVISSPTVFKKVLAYIKNTLKSNSYFYFQNNTTIVIITSSLS